jgi:hypothetical protein
MYFIGLSVHRIVCLPMYSLPDFQGPLLSTTLPVPQAVQLSHEFCHWIWKCWSESVAQFGHRLLQSSRFKCFIRRASPDTAPVRPHAATEAPSLLEASTSSAYLLNCCVWLFNYIIFIYYTFVYYQKSRTKRHWDRCFSSTSVSPADHSTNFSIIIITRGRHNRPLLAAGPSGPNWTPLPPPPRPNIPIKTILGPHIFLSTLIYEFLAPHTYVSFEGRGWFPNFIQRCPPQLGEDFIPSLFLVLCMY